MITVAQRVRAVTEYDWEKAGLPTPSYGPLQWTAVAKHIYSEYKPTHVKTLEDIAAQEGMKLVWAPTLTCGLSVGRLLVVSYYSCTDARFFSFHHERGHVHAERLLIGANESDVWGVSLRIAKIYLDSFDLSPSIVELVKRFN